MSPALLGFVRALGTIILMSVLTYLGDATHFNGILSATGATILAGLALALEHAIENKTGSGLFGAVHIKY